MISNKIKQQNNQKGQVFLEFILALVMLMSITFLFAKGYNRLIGTRWEIMIQIIAGPDAKGRGVYLP